VLRSTEILYVVAAAERLGMRCTIETNENTLTVYARPRVDMYDMPHIYERGEIK
jgi:hypothetical protein